MKRLAILAVVVVCGTAPAADVTTLSGKKLTGDVVAVSPKGVTLKSAGGEESVPASDLLLVELAAVSPAKDKFTEIELTDGSVLACSAVVLKGDRAELTLTSGPVVSTPLASVASLLQNAHDPAVRLQWQLLLRKRGQLDMLVVTNEGKLDALDGTFGPGTEAGDAIEFTLASAEQKLTPKLARAAGLVFVRRPDPDAPAPLCKVTDVTGNVFAAGSVRLDRETVVVKLVGGGTVRFAGLPSLARLDFSKGKLTYLSDLEPVDKEQTSTEDLIFPYRRDRNLYGSPLRLKGVIYPKGVAAHSRTALTYDIGGDYKEFRAVLGVDDVIRNEGGPPVRVNVVVEGDGRELFKAEVQSRDEPRPVALDVKGVQRLRIVVAAPLLDLGNQVNLCEARVSK